MAVDRISRRQVVRASSVAIATAALSTPFVQRAAAADEPLKFWQFYSGGAVPAQVKWFNDTVKAWNDTQPTKVELVFVPSPEYLGGTKLPTAFASGAGPDIFLLSPGDFLRYYNGGVLLDMTPYISKEAQADFIDGVIANRKVDGKIYAVPMEIGQMAMYYSVAAFKEIGRDENSVPKTWDELLQVAKQLTNDKRYGVLFETNPNYYQNFTWYPFLWQGGGDIQTPEGRSAFNSPATAQALRFWQDAIVQKVAPTKPLGGGGFDIVANLASGYCAMQNVSISGIASMKAGAPNFEYGIFRLPTPPGGKYLTVGGGWAWAVNAKGKKPDVAAQFCAWALASMSPDSIARGADWCVNARAYMAPRTSVAAKTTSAFDSGPLKIFRDQVAPSTRAEPRLPPQVYKVISDAIQACQLGGKDPVATAASASAQLDEFLASYRGAPMF